MSRLETVATLIRRWRVKTIKPFGRTSPDGLRISVGDSNPDVANALAAAFAGPDQAEVVEGNLLDLPCDAIVSPANSFGDMGAASTRPVTIPTAVRPNGR